MGSRPSHLGSDTAATHPHDPSDPGSTGPRHHSQRSANPLKHSGWLNGSTDPRQLHSRKTSEETPSSQSSSSLSPSEKFSHRLPALIRSVPEKCLAPSPASATRGRGRAFVKRAFSMTKYPRISMSALTSSPSLHAFTFAEVMAATCDKRTVVGVGGFGSVYKGLVLDTDANEAVAVAVKVLHAKAFESDEDLLREMSTVSSLQHPCILRLLGYCMEQCKALVYEFMPGGDVDQLLQSCRTNGAVFPWAARLRVAHGCAAALEFMNEKRVIHRDFKASNVLLTQDMQPCVADFGLAKAMTDWRSHVTTRVKGSFGYMDPAYFLLGHVHIKTDVYAFGVFLVELLTGKSVMRDQVHDTIIPVLHAATGTSLETSLQEILDPAIDASDADVMRQAVILAELAKMALAEKWDDRPSMGFVLESVTEAVWGCD